MRFKHLFGVTKQTPAEGIRLDYKSNDSVFYTVTCNCGNEDDNVEFSIDIDEDTKDILLHSYLKLKTDYYTQVFSECEYVHNPWLYELNYWVASFINGLTRRIKFTWNMWVHGYVEFHTYTILNEKRATNYAMSILDAIREFKKNK